MPKRQAATSLEYVMVPVEVVPPEAGVESDVVELAFIAGRDFDRPTSPASGDWHTATWLHVGGSRVAACLVGPTAVQLARGDYIVWVRIHDNPEVPAIAADVLTIT